MGMIAYKLQLFWSISFSDDEFKRDFRIYFYVIVDPPPPQIVAEP